MTTMVVDSALTTAQFREYSGTTNSNPPPVDNAPAAPTGLTGSGSQGGNALDWAAPGGRRFDYVISLCDRVREVCPEFGSRPDRAHWSVADPSLDGSTDRETLPAFERTVSELETRIRFRFHPLVNEAPKRRPRHVKR